MGEAIAVMDIQLLAVILIFSGACFYLGRRFFFRKKQEAGCDKCGMAGGPAKKTPEHQA